MTILKLLDIRKITLTLKPQPDTHAWKHSCEQQGVKMQKQVKQILSVTEDTMYELTKNLPSSHVRINRQVDY